ncbi:hexamerin 70a-like [Lasioglossum baleicum]|uniref:hexamerin 70a-like n=1 Tax=Lasioglossum baleicum TaxID=434251 RepID=UPI003FCC4030
MLRLWLLGLVAGFVVVANAYHSKHTFHPSADFVVKQKQIFHLLNHLVQPDIATPDLYNKARNWDLNKNRDDFKDERVVDNYLYLRNISSLKRGEIFSTYHPEHIKELKALYELFINAKDYSNFYDVATWAKVYENEGKFVYALYTALLTRPDTNEFRLQQLYEKYPYLYFNAEVVKAAIDYKSGTKITGRPPVVPYKMFYANYSGWNVNHEINVLNKVNYFVEDIGLNQYYTYLTLNNPYWLKKSHSTKRGEEYLYSHKHLLNRYNLEKLSNGLPFVEDFAWTTPFPISYEPNLIYHNGLPVPHRQALAPYPTAAYGNIRKILNFEARIAAAIDSGNVLTSENKWVNINNFDGLNILGNLIEGNEDSVNKYFYGSIDRLARTILGYTADDVNEQAIIPSVLQTSIASLRDPAFFSIYNRIVGLYEKYKLNQKPYTVENVIFKSLNIKSVAIDSLVTFFDYFKTDINDGLLIQNTDQATTETIDVIQLRLNHHNFTYNITVDSAVRQQASVKIFLGPKYDVNNKLIELPQGYLRFYELDNWQVTLNEGENVISRNSLDAIFTIPDYPSTKEFLEHLHTDSELLKQIGGFPQRLLLPKGSAEGQVFQLFVYIKPFEVLEEVKYHSSLFGDAVFDKTPLGFPLDKPIDELKFSQNNFKLVDIVIKHETTPEHAEINIK